MSRVRLPRVVAEFLLINYEENYYPAFAYDSDDDGAGNDCDQIDMIELTIERC